MSEQEMNLNFTVVTGTSCENCGTLLSKSSEYKTTVYARIVRYCPTCGQRTEIVCHKCGHITRFADNNI